MNNAIFKRTITNMKRSGWRTYAVIFTMTVTFLILGVLLSVIYTSQNLATFFEQKPEVIGFFNDDVTEDQILNVRRDLESKDYVAEIKYVSREEAMQSFLDDSQDNAAIIEGLTANIFPPHLNVKAVSLARIKDVSEYFKNNELISDVSDSENAIPVLQKIVTGIQVFGLLLLAVFSMSTMFIIFLSVGITVYSQKSEIIIMKLVGASDWYVRAPYLLQSFIYSIVAVLLSALVLIPLLITQYNSIMYLLVESNEVSAISWPVLLIGLGVELLFGALLAFFSSYFATRRYIDY